MKVESVCDVFDALSQPNRLKIFRILVEHCKEGITPTEISEKMNNMPRNTLSFHLSLLTNVGLCTTKKDGKKVIYKAKCCMIKKIAGFLLEKCCEGEFEC